MNHIPAETYDSDPADGRDCPLCPGRITVQYDCGEPVSETCDHCHTVWSDDADEVA